MIRFVGGFPNRDPDDHTGVWGYDGTVAELIEILQSCRPDARVQWVDPEDGSHCRSDLVEDLQTRVNLGVTWYRSDDEVPL